MIGKNKNLYLKRNVKKFKEKVQSLQEQNLNKYHWVKLQKQYFYIDFEFYFQDKRHPDPNNLLKQVIDQLQVIHTLQQEQFHQITVKIEREDNIMFQTVNHRKIFQQQFFNNFLSQIISNPNQYRVKSIEINIPETTFQQYLTEFDKIDQLMTPQKELIIKTKENENYSFSQSVEGQVVTQSSVLLSFVSDIIFKIQYTDENNVLRLVIYKFYDFHVFKTEDCGNFKKIVDQSSFQEDLNSFLQQIRI